MLGWFLGGQVDDGVGGAGDQQQGQEQQSDEQEFLTAPERSDAAGRTI